MPANARHRLIAIAVLSLLANAPASAQATLPAAPAAGTWGAELTSQGGVGGASLLRFSSPRAAWLFGAGFDVSREITEQSLPGFGTLTDTTRSAFVQLRAGRRWYRGETTERLRPITGLGLSGRYSPADDGRYWQAGGYGELGAVWFFSPHVSLGATGELYVMRTEQRREPDVGARFVQRRWDLGANVAQLKAAVYF